MSSINQKKLCQKLKKENKKAREIIMELTATCVAVSMLTPFECEPLERVIDKAERFIKNGSDYEFDD